MVEQPFDCVAFRFVTTHSSDRDDEWFGSTEHKAGKVAIALGGAIAGYRPAEFAYDVVWTAVIVDIDEVETDDPRGGAEDHRCLLGEKVVDDVLKLISRDGMELSKCLVVGLGSESGVSDRHDGFLIDSCLEERLPDNLGVEAATFDSGDRDLRQEIFR